MDQNQRSIIREFIIKTLQITDTTKFNEESDLSELGLDSINAMQIAIGLEEQFKIRIVESDLLYKNFSNLNAIYKFLEKYF